MQRDRAPCPVLHLILICLVLTGWTLKLPPLHTPFPPYIHFICAGCTRLVPYLCNEAELRLYQDYTPPALLVAYHQTRAPRYGIDTGQPPNTRRNAPRTG